MDGPGQDERKKMFKDQVKSKFSFFNDISSAEMPSMHHWELSNWLKNNAKLIHDVVQDPMSEGHLELFRDTFLPIDASFLKDKMSSEGGVIAWITLLAIAGFSPVPFKLLTITSGFINFNILYFVVISILTRGLRFFLIAFFVGNFGPTMKKIIEKRLLKFSIFLSIILIIFAYFVYKFLNNFIN